MPLTPLGFCPSEPFPRAKPEYPFGYFFRPLAVCLLGWLGFRDLGLVRIRYFVDPFMESSKSAALLGFQPSRVFPFPAMELLLSSFSLGLSRF